MPRKDEFTITRQFHPTDPRLDRTVILVRGKLDSRKAVEIQGILNGTHMAKRRPGKGGQA